MPRLPPPPRRNPFTDPSRRHRPVRCARIRPRDRGPWPRGRMSAMGLDDADGWRCRGVLMARREDGDAHEWVGRVLDGCLVRGRGGGGKGVEVWEEARFSL